MIYQEMWSKIELVFVYYISNLTKAIKSTEIAIFINFWETNSQRDGPIII